MMYSAIQNPQIFSVNFFYPKIFQIKLILTSDQNNLSKYKMKISNHDLIHERNKKLSRPHV